MLKPVTLNFKALEGFVSLLREADPREVTTETAFQYLSRYYPQLTDERYKGAFCEKLVANDRPMLVCFNKAKIKTGLADASYRLINLLSDSHPHGRSLVFMPIHGQTAEAVMVAATELQRLLEQFEYKLSRLVRPQTEPPYMEEADLVPKLESLHLLLSGYRKFYGIVPDNKDKYGSLSHRSCGSYVASIMLEYIHTLLRYFDEIDTTADYNRYTIITMCHILTVICDLAPSDNSWRCNHGRPKLDNDISRLLETGVDSMTAMDLIECMCKNRYSAIALVKDRIQQLSLNEIRRRNNAVLHRTCRAEVIEYVDDLTYKWQRVVDPKRFTPIGEML